ncbi:MAG: sigma-70 family RNA polymerase sigma factor [Myxococcota bacterium]
MASESGSSTSDDLLPLLQRFAAGDEAAFEELMRRHGGLVRRVIAGRVRSAFDREEVEQEVWLQVYRSRGTLDLQQHATFPRWLSTVTYRKCMDLLRRRRLVEKLAFAEGVPLLAETTEPEQTAETRELLAAAEEFKRKLKPEWCAFFELHFIQGLEYKEVGSRLSIGYLRCKYMRRVLAFRAQKNRRLMDALGRYLRTQDGGRL